MIKLMPAISLILLLFAAACSSEEPLPDAGVVDSGQIVPDGGLEPGDDMVVAEETPDESEIEAVEADLDDLIIP